MCKVKVFEVKFLIQTAEVLLVLFILIGCAPSRICLSNLSAQEREKVSQIMILDSADIPLGVEYELLERIEIWECDFAFDEVEMIQEIKARAAAVNAQAVINIHWWKERHSDWSYCPKRIFVSGDAVKFTTCKTKNFEQKV